MGDEWVEEPTEETKSFFEASAITIEELRKLLPKQDYDTLTFDDDEIANHNLFVATLRVQADVESTGNVFDIANSKVRLALSKMWIYEMFQFIGQTENAKQYYEDYALIVKTCFGEIRTKNDSGSGETVGPAVATIAKPSWCRYGR